MTCVAGPLRRQAWRAALGAAAVALLASCQGKVLSPTPGDQLRRRNAELEAQVSALELQVSESRTSMASLQSQLAQAKSASGTMPGAEGAARELSPEALEATPHLARISVGSRSHTDTPLSGEGCVARIYMEPQDGLGRFMQVVGTVSATLYWVRPGCEAEAISCKEFGPLAIRDAYRSGFGGTHYTLEWPVELKVPITQPDGGAARVEWTCGDGVEVRLEFTDARSGRVFMAQRILPALAPLEGGGP